MSEVSVYHNPRCTKSRNSLSYLDERGVSYDVKLYFEDPLTHEELKMLISKLGISATDLLRKNEAIYKEEFKGKELTEDQWIEAMISHPKLMERPIIVKGNKAVIARPTEKIDELID